MVHEAAKYITSTPNQKILDQTLGMTIYSCGHSQVIGQPLCAVIRYLPSNCQQN